MELVLPFSDFVLAYGLRNRRKKPGGIACKKWENNAGNMAGVSPNAYFSELSRRNILPIELAGFIQRESR